MGRLRPRWLTVVTAIWSLSVASQPWAPDTLRLRVAWEVAEGRHATADSLGELSGIAMDSSGHVYVSDVSAVRIWVFARDGRSLAAIGRRGQGPGEFQAPTGIAIGPDGRLYVRDAAKVTRFATDPATRRLSRYDGAFQGPPFADWKSKRASRFDRDGRMYYPAFGTVSRDRRSGFYYRYSPAGALVDSIEVPAFPGAPAATASVRFDAHRGRRLSGLNHVPFAPLPAWDVTVRGTLLLGMGSTYALREVDDSGRTLRVIQRAVTPDRIPAEMRLDSLRALRARLDSVRVPLDRVQGMPADVRHQRLPRDFPAFMAAYATPDGRSWVRRWPPKGAKLSVFDVFDVDGRLRWVVVLPRVIAVDPTPVLSLSAVAAVGIDPETGANTVLAFVMGAGR